MEYPTKEKLKLAEHPVTPVPGSSEASAEKPEEANSCCFCCSYRTGSINIAYFYLVMYKSCIGFIISQLYGIAARDVEAIYFVALTVLIISIVLIFLMLDGAVKRRHQDLLTWAVWEGLVIVLETVYLVILLFSYDAILLVLFIVPVFQGFWVFVVLRYRGQLMAQKSEGNAQA